jgi:hypothetical protein
MEMDETGILSTIAFIASVLGIIVGLINHKKVAVVCCGKRRVIAIDIDDTNKPSPPVVPSPIKKPVIKIDEQG